MTKIGFSPLNPYRNTQTSNKRCSFKGKDTTFRPETPKKKSNILIKGLLCTAGTAFLALGAIAITKGRAVSQKHKLLASIPADLQALFERVKGLEGNAFIDKSYKELVEYMGLKGIAPKEIIHRGSDGIWSITGGYDPVKNTIGFSDGFWTNLSKAEQFGMLSHELTHCKQFTDMLRTEGIGIEKYIECQVDSIVKNILGPESTNFVLKMDYETACKAGRKEEFLEKLREAFSKKISPEIQENFREVLAMPKIPANSPEGQKAFANLEANRNYEGLGMFGWGSDKYKNNPLEVEAYGFGEKMINYFKNYEKATKM